MNSEDMQDYFYWLQDGEDGQALVYNENGHLAIDCGCVYGKRLAVYCLDDGSVEYVDKR